MAHEDRGIEPSAQPAGYQREDAERRVTEKLGRHARLPDAAMVTIFLGDLRALAGR